MSNRKRKQRRNNFTGGFRASDDTPLSPEATALDSQDPLAIEPLTTSDPDAIDRLLNAASFEINDAPEKTVETLAQELDYSPIEAQTAAPSTPVAELLSAQALPVSEPAVFAQEPAAAKVDLSKNKADFQVNEFIRSYFDKRVDNAERLARKKSPAPKPKTVKPPEPEELVSEDIVVMDNQDFVDVDAIEPPPFEATYIPEATPITETQAETRLYDFVQVLERKQNSNSRVAYIALACAVLALASSVALGLWSVDAKAKLNKLNELIAIIEEDVAGINEKTAGLANNSNAMPANVAAVSTKEAAKTFEVAAPSTSTAALLPPAVVDNTPKPAPAPPPVHNAPAPVHKKVAPHNNLAAIDLTPPVAAKAPLESSNNAAHSKKSSSATAHEALSKVLLPATALDTKNKGLDAPKKAETAKKDAAIKKAEIAKKDASAKKAEIAKKDESAKKIETAKKDAPAKKVETAKKETPVTANSSKKSGDGRDSAGTWVVNIAASKQKEFIQTQAANLKSRGVPVSIVPVTVNNGTWYRLRIGSFKDKEAATAYAHKIQSSYNLNSVWVGGK